MSEPRICLVFVFNHKYDQNIEKLASLYGPRFPDIRYLVPFYQGSRPDVFPAYESSAQFQGYFAQAAHWLIDPAYDYYAFLADDLLLNPELNAANIASSFGLSDGAAYIEDLKPLSGVPLEWPHMLGVFEPFRVERFVKFAQEIPDRSAAAARLAGHGIHSGNLRWANMRGFGGWNMYPGFFRHLKFMAKRRGSVPLPYPMLMTYADLVIVPRQAIQEFCHLCGVFAAMGLWVEVAVPTALALTCPRITQLSQTGRRGLAIWNQAEVDELARKSNHQVHNVFAAVGTDCLYVHPVKLSQWTL